jgi:hypothetical protein
MLRTPSRVNGTRAHFFSPRWAHTRLSTKACASEGDEGRSTGSGLRIVKLVGAEDYSALRASPSGSPAQSRRRSTWPSAKLSNLPFLMSQVRPNGDIEAELPWDNFLKMVGATGFEPATLWSQTRCATRLRHAPNLPTATGRVGAVIVPWFALHAGTLQPVDG